MFKTKTLIALAAIGISGGVSAIEIDSNAYHVSWQGAQSLVTGNNHYSQDWLDLDAGMDEGYNKLWFYPMNEYSEHDIITVRFTNSDGSPALLDLNACGTPRMTYSDKDYFGPDEIVLGLWDQANWTGEEIYFRITSLENNQFIFPNGIWPGKFFVKNICFQADTVIPPLGPKVELDDADEGYDVVNQISAHIEVRSYATNVPGGVLVDSSAGDEDTVVLSIKDQFTYYVDKKYDNNISTRFLSMRKLFDCSDEEDMFVSWGDLIDYLSNNIEVDENACTFADGDRAKITPKNKMLYYPATLNTIGHKITGSNFEFLNPANVPGRWDEAATITPYADNDTFTGFSASYAPGNSNVMVTQWVNGGPDMVTLDFDVDDDHHYMNGPVLSPQDFNSGLTFNFNQWHSYATGSSEYCRDLGMWTIDDDKDIIVPYLKLGTGYKVDLYVTNTGQANDIDWHLDYMVKGVDETWTEVNNLQSHPGYKQIVRGVTKINWPAVATVKTATGASMAEVALRLRFEEDISKLTVYAAYTDVATGEVTVINAFGHSGSDSNHLLKFVENLYNAH